MIAKTLNKNRNKIKMKNVLRVVFSFMVAFTLTLTTPIGLQKASAAPLEDCDLDGFDDATGVPVPWPGYDETKGDTPEGPGGSVAPTTAPSSSNNNTSGTTSGGNTGGISGNTNNTNDNTNNTNDNTSNTSTGNTNNTSSGSTNTSGNNNTSSNTNTSTSGSKDNTSSGSKNTTTSGNTSTKGNTTSNTNTSSNSNTSNNTSTSGSKNTSSGSSNNASAGSANTAAAGSTSTTTESTTNTSTSNSNSSTSNSGVSNDNSSSNTTDNVDSVTTDNGEVVSTDPNEATDDATESTDPSTTDGQNEAPQNENEQAAVGSETDFTEDGSVVAEDISYIINTKGALQITETTGSLIHVGSSVVITGTGFIGNLDNLEIEIHSDGRQLGNVTSLEDGSFEAQVNIPEDLETGTHNIVVLYQGQEITRQLIEVGPKAADSFIDALTVGFTKDNKGLVPGLVILAGLLGLGAVVFVGSAVVRSRKK